MKKLVFLMFIFVFIQTGYASSIMPMEIILDADNVPVYKLDRNSMRSCLESKYERICIDGSTVKEICKVVVNGSVVMATAGQGAAMTFIASTAGLLISDLVCERYTIPICREILVCRRWAQ